jgi:N-acyl-D-aspartate/D-glutamate deacylase
VERLLWVIGRSGHGVFELAPDPESRSPEPEVRNAWADRMRALAVATGVPITGPLPLRLIESTAEAGGRMFGQVHSRGIASIFSFRTRLPFDDLADWRTLRAEPESRQRQLLTDPAVRQRLVEAVHHGDYGESFGAEIHQPDFDRLRVFDQVLPPFPTVNEVAAQRRMDPVELMIDLAVRSDFDQLFLQFLGMVDEGYQLRAMKHPRTVMTFSDAGAHVSQISDCSIQTYLFAYWMRERGEFTLEEAVRMITLQPALAWGFADRGLVREGMVADLNVFDPETVAPQMPVIIDDLPGGGQRLVQRADGFLATVVAGEVVHRDGRHTGALPGRLLRSAGA